MSRLQCARQVPKHGQPFPEWVFSSVTGTALDESDVRKAFNRVSRQLVHRDASITLRVFARWVPDVSTARAVNLLDDAQASATQLQPATEAAE